MASKYAAQSTLVDTIKTPQYGFVAWRRRKGT